MPAYACFLWMKLKLNFLKLNRYDSESDLDILMCVLNLDSWGRKVSVFTDRNNDNLHIKFTYEFNKEHISFLDLNATFLW